MTLDEFNALSFDAAREAMLEACGSEAWAVEMAAKRPFASLEALKEAAEAQWWRLGEYGWLEAFRAHPVMGAPDIHGIASLRRQYHASFGFTFVFCAEGKTPEDELEVLRGRIENRPEAEMTFAAEEQAKITQLRLDRLFTHEGT